MEKQTKNIITREWVTNELRFYNKADIKAGLVLFCMFALIVVLIVTPCVLAILSQSEDIFAEVITLIIPCLIIVIPAVMFLRGLCVAFSEKKLLNNGDFDIEVCELQYKDEKMMGFGMRNLKEFLHFEGFKGVMVDHTQFQLATMGDEYYIVHYRNKKDIKLFYSLKMYEYRER